jgi:hypothetical protein
VVEVAVASSPLMEVVAEVPSCHCFPVPARSLSSSLPATCCHRVHCLQMTTYRDWAAIDHACTHCR